MQQARRLETPSLSVTWSRHLRRRADPRSNQHFNPGSGPGQAPAQLRDNLLGLLALVRHSRSSYS
jgi:hypothetical protein